jgi:ribosomal protein S18 acetylase RimI-like enzyme
MSLHDNLDDTTSGVDHLSFVFRRRHMKIQKIPVHLRPARPDDQPHLEALLPRLLVGLGPWRDATLWQEATQRSLTGALRDETLGGTLLVAAGNGDQPLGFISMLRDTNWSGEPQLYISDLAVVPEAEGYGVARALLDAAEQRARAADIRFLALDVHADNARARVVYVHYGFVEESLRLVKVLDERDAPPKA